MGTTRAKYLVHTDWVLDHLDGDWDRRSALELLREDGLALSTASLAELQEGVFSGEDADGQSSLLADFLADVELLPIDAEVCVIFGRERARLRAEGRLVSDLELMTVATALRHELVLLTEREDLQSRFPELRLRTAQAAVAPEG